MPAPTAAVSTKTTCDSPQASTHVIGVPGTIEASNDMQSVSTLPRAVGSAQTPSIGRRVVDAPTRAFHWLFAASFLGAFVTGDSETWRSVHVALGYLMPALLGFRLLYGIAGPRYARLAPTWRKLAGLPAWLRSMRQGRWLADVDWRHGENLLIALLVVAMLVAVVPLALSGVVVYEEWGGDWLEEVHEFFGNAFLALAGAHVAALVGSSVLRRRNRMVPMITGRASGSGPDLVRSNRTWLAVLLWIASIGFVAWQLL